MGDAEVTSAGGRGPNESVPGAQEKVEAAPAAVSEAEVVTKFIQGIAAPIKDASRATQREVTKRMQIWSDVVKWLIVAGCIVAGAVITLACIAVSSGHPDLAVNLVVAVVGFAGGFGLGRGGLPGRSE